MIRPMVGLFRPAIAYGIDGGGGACGVVRARRAWGRDRLDVVYAGPETAPEAEAALRAAGDDQRGGAAPIAMILPARLAAHRRLAVPSVSRRVAGRILPSRLDVELPFPLERSRYLFSELCRVEKGWSSFAVAVPEEDVVRACATAPADPWILDAEAPAAWEAAIRDGLPGTGPAAVFAAGYGRWMWVAGLDGAPDLVIAGRAPSDEAPEAEWESFAADVAARVRRGLEPQGPGGSRAACFWAGPAFARADRARRLRETIAPDAASHMTAADPGTWLAGAAAQRAVGGDFPHNLREGALAAGGLVRKRSVRSRRAMLGAAAAGVLLAGVSLAATWMIDGARAGLRSRVMGEAVRIVGHRNVVPGREVETAGAHVERMEAEVKPFRDLLVPVRESLLGRALKAAAQRGIRIESVELTRTGHRIEGTALSLAMANQWADEMEAPPEGSTGNYRHDPPDAEGRVRFSLEGAVP